MKTDLTHLPPDKQLAHVCAYVMNRVQTGGGRAQKIYATDLMEKFKHRGAGLGLQRLQYFSGLLATANKMIAHAMGQAPAEPTPPPAAVAPTDGTPPPRAIAITDFNSI